MSDNRDFLESLANKSNHDKEYEVELARASSSSIQKKSNLDIEDEEAQLTVDVYQTAENIIIESAIAGVSPDELDVSINMDNVIIRGSRERKEKIKGDDYLYQECYWGKFARSIDLPEDIDVDSSEASIKNGVLTITLPKLRKSKQRKLKVKGD